MGPVVEVRVTEGTQLMKGLATMEDSSVSHCWRLHEAKGEKKEEGGMAKIPARV